MSPTPFLVLPVKSINFNANTKLCEFFSGTNDCYNYLYVLIFPDINFYLFMKNYNRHVVSNNRLTETNFVSFCYNIVNRSFNFTIVASVVAFFTMHIFSRLDGSVLDILNWLHSQTSMLSTLQKQLSIFRLAVTSYAFFTTSINSFVHFQIYNVLTFLNHPFCSQFTVNFRRLNCFFS